MNSGDHHLPSTGESPADVEDVLAQLAVAVSTVPTAQVLETFIAYIHEYQGRGRAQEVLRLLEARSRLVPESSLGPVGAAWLMNERGNALMALGRRGEAREAYTELARLGRDLGDTELVGTAEQNLGIVAHLDGDHDASRRHFAEAARRKLAEDDTYAALQILLNVGALDLDAGRLDEAERHLTDLGHLLRGGRAPHLNMTLHGHLSRLAVERGDLMMAEQHARRALELARRCGDEGAVALGMHTVGNICLESGDARNALRWYGRALRVADDLDRDPLRLLARQGRATVLLRQERYAEAEQELLISRNLAARVGDQGAAARALADLGALRLLQRRDNEAKEALYEARTELEELGDLEYLVRVLANLAEVHRLHGALVAADGYINEALALPAEGQWAERVDLLQRAAEVRLFDKATFDQGLAYLRRAVEVRTMFVDDLPARAWAYVQAATLLAANGDRHALVASLSYYAEALALYDETSDEVLVWQVRNDRANALTALGRYEEALSEHRICLAVAERRADRALTQQATHNLGEALGRAGVPVEARPMLERSVTLARELGNQRDEASTLGSLGIVQGQLGDIAAAESCFGRALDLGQSLDSPSAEAVALGGLALVAFERGEYALARDRYAAAAAIEERLDDRRHLIESLAGWVEALAALGETADMEVEAQRLMDLAQAIGAEELASRALGRAGRWYLGRGELDEAASLYEASIAGALALLGDDEESEQRATEALLFSTMLALTHARDSKQDSAGLIGRVVAQLELNYPGSGSLVSSTVSMASATLGWTGAALTVRELEALRLAATGLKTKAISEKLNVSMATIQNRMHRIMRKMGVTSRTEAIRLAREWGLVPRQPDSH